MEKDELSNVGDTAHSPSPDSGEANPQRPYEGEIGTAGNTQRDDADSEPLPWALENILREIDPFLVILQKHVELGKSIDSVEIPAFIIKFLNLVEKKIGGSEVGQVRRNWCEDSLFMESVDRISKLVKLLSDEKQSSSPEKITQRNDSSMNRLGAIQQLMMSFLEEEFRLIMEESRILIASDLGAHDPKGKQHQHVEQPATDSVSEPPEDQSVINFIGYSDHAISNLNKIARSMIASGYRSECCQVYIVARRQALEESLQNLGFQKTSIDEIQKMQWDALEKEIPTWIKTSKACANVFFLGERKLVDSVFAEHPSMAAGLFSTLSRGVIIQLFNFAEGVSMTKRTSETKLYKFLDMYETLCHVIPKLYDLYPKDCVNEIKNETLSAKCRLGESAVSLFCDLENSIKSDPKKTPIPGGAVHPLTTQIMNYVLNASDYTDTLDQVFWEHSKIGGADSTSRPPNSNAENSPFRLQLVRLMDLLDSNLETRAKQYKETALSCIFMMNNGRYILQKIKGANNICQVMGDPWVRKRSSDLRTYHKNYQRETWSRVLQFLNPEGLTVNGKVPKPMLKERFKSFNSAMDEIHKTQSSWVVNDKQLQSELRVSISSVVIPAYRAFVGRFSQNFDPGRQTEKYIKFQPDDLETYIEELFDGNPLVNHNRKKSKATDALSKATDALSPF